MGDMAGMAGMSGMQGMSGMAPGMVMVSPEKQQLIGVRIGNSGEKADGQNRADGRNHHLR